MEHKPIKLEIKVTILKSTFEKPKEELPDNVIPSQRLEEKRRLRDLGVT